MTLTSHSSAPRGRFLLGRSIAGSFLLAAATAGALAANIGFAGTASAAELRLKSGQTWRGELNDNVELVYKQGGRQLTVQGKVTRADSTMIVIEAMVDGKVAKTSIFFGDVVSMKSLATGAERNEKGTPATATANPAATTNPPAKGAAGDATKVAAPASGEYKGVFFLTLEGVVGTGARHEQIDEVAKEADKLGPGQIIVLEIDSPGGLVLEAQNIHTSLAEIKKRHRLVAWIKKAISAAAFTAFHCDEIYFMSMGSMGSMTMFSGHEDVAKGASLESWLAIASEVAKEGGRDPHIARCMIVKDLVCSYDIPEGGGPKDARFRDDMKGKYLVDGPDTMLTFTAAGAAACGFSDGTADTTEALGKLMGLPEWKEINGDGPGSGRKIYRDWQSLLTRGTSKMVELWVSLNYKGNWKDEPEAVLATKVSIIEELIRWVERCEGCMWGARIEQSVGIPPKEGLEEILKNVREQIADIKRARRDARR